MPIDFTSDPVPLHYNEHGVIRVGRTRVRLDSVIFEFKQGATADQIVDAFPTLELADVHAVLAFYLRHRPEVDAYLEDQERLAEQLRAEVEARWPTTGLREKLEARLAARRASA